MQKGKQCTTLRRYTVLERGENPGHTFVVPAPLQCRSEREERELVNARYTRQPRDLFMRETQKVKNLSRSGRVLPTSGERSIVQPTGFVETHIAVSIHIPNSCVDTNRDAG